MNPSYFNNSTNQFSRMQPADRPGPSEPVTQPRYQEPVRSVQERVAEVAQRGLTQPAPADTGLSLEDRMLLSTITSLTTDEQMLALVSAAIADKNALLIKALFSHNKFKALSIGSTWNEETSKTDKDVFDSLKDVLNSLIQNRQTKVAVMLYEKIISDICSLTGDRNSGRKLTNEMILFALKCAHPEFIQNVVQKRRNDSFTQEAFPWLVRTGTCGEGVHPDHVEVFLTALLSTREKYSPLSAGDYSGLNGRLLPDEARNKLFHSDFQMMLDWALRNKRTNFILALVEFKYVSWKLKLQSCLQIYNYAISHLNFAICDQLFKFDELNRLEPNQFVRLCEQVNALPATSSLPHDFYNAPNEDINRIKNHPFWTTSPAAIRYRSANLGPALTAAILRGDSLETIQQLWPEGVSTNELFESAVLKKIWRKMIEENNWALAQLLFQRCRDNPSVKRSDSRAVFFDCLYEEVAKNSLDVVRNLLLIKVKYSDGLEKFFFNELSNGFLELLVKNNRKDLIMGLLSQDFLIRIPPADLLHALKCAFDPGDPALVHCLLYPQGEKFDVWSVKRPGFYEVFTQDMLIAVIRHWICEQSRALSSTGEKRVLRDLCIKMLLNTPIAKGVSEQAKKELIDYARECKCEYLLPVETSAS